MITLIAIPLDFDPLEKENFKLIQSTSDWTEHIKYCNNDLELAKKLLVDGIKYLSTRGILSNDEHKWDCDRPEFAFKFIYELVSSIFSFQLDNIFMSNNNNTDEDYILNVMLYSDKIQSLLDPKSIQDKFI